MADARTATIDLAALLPGPLLCAECAARVCTASSRLPGVLESACDETVLRLTYDPALLAADELPAALGRLVAEATVGVEHAAYRVAGLD